MDIRDVLGCDPTGTRCLAACFGTDLPVTLEQIRPWVVRRGSVEVMCAEARAHLSLEPQRPWSDPAIARTTPCWFALCSHGTVQALPLRPWAQLPVSIAAWSHQDAPPCTDCLALGRGHR